MVGAVGGQLTQALGSFVLQLIAVHALGAAGLGTFALLYSGLILVTAVVTGLVGDSLVVLDRSRRTVRAALQNWCLILGVFAGSLGAVGAAVVGLVSWPTAFLFGIATVIFTIEDSLRRLLMGCLRFWSLLAVDLSALAVAIAVVFVVSSQGQITLTTLLSALIAGQLVAAAVAIGCLPAMERRLVTPRPSVMGEVFSYGRWRAGYRGLRNGVLTGTRVIVTAGVGVASYGHLEAARLYVAPVLLLVSGMGGYLLPTNALSSHKPMKVLVKHADGFAIALLAGSVGLAVIATLLTPSLGAAIMGSKVRLDPVAVLAWGSVAAASATVLPYGSLAAVRDRQAQLVGFRLADSILSLILVATLLLVSPDSISLTPFALTIGALLGGILVRNRLLIPLVRAEEDMNWSGPSSTASQSQSLAGGR